MPFGAEKLFDQGGNQTLKDKDIIDALNDIDPDMVEDAERIYTRKQQGNRLRSVGVLAACIGVMASIVIFGVLNREEEPTQNMPEGDTFYNPTTYTGGGSTLSPSGTTVAFTSVDPNRDTGLRKFSSISEYINYEKGVGDLASECFYIPSAIDDKFELWNITKQEPCEIVSFSFVDVKYKFKGVNITGDNFVEERLNSISCRYSINEYSSLAFENYVKGGGFEAVDGRAGMYKTLHYSSDNKILVSYQVIFLEEGHLISMQLPAIDSFDNLLIYTNVVKKNIK